MKRRKKPTKTVSTEKKKIKKTINALSGNGWNAEDRETSILFDHSNNVIYLETSHGMTARKWFKNLWGMKGVKFDTHSDSLKIQVPWEFCRRPDLILKPKFRK